MRRLCCLSGPGDGDYLRFNLLEFREGALGRVAAETDWSSPASGAAILSKLQRGLDIWDARWLEQGGDGEWQNERTHFSIFGANAMVYFDATYNHASCGSDIQDVEYKISAQAIDLGDEVIRSTVAAPKVWRAAVRRTDMGYLPDSSILILISMLRCRSGKGPMQLGIAL